MKPNTDRAQNEIAEAITQLEALSEYITANETRLNDNQIYKVYVCEFSCDLIITPKIKGTGKDVARLFGGLDWEKFDAKHNYFWFKAEAVPGVTLNISNAEEILPPVSSKLEL